MVAAAAAAAARSFNPVLIRATASCRSFFNVSRFLFSLFLVELN